MRSYNEFDILLNAYKDLNNEEVKVTGIAVEGCERTRASTVKRAFSTAYKAQTLSQLSKAISSGIDRSNQLSVHDKVVVNLLTDDKDPNGIVLQVVVSEKEVKPRVTVGAEVSDKGNVSANAGVKVRSLFGLAEEYNLQLDITQKKNVGILGRTTIPMFPTLDGSLSFAFYTMMKERVTQLMQCSTDGVSVSTRLNPNHELVYKFDLRNNSNSATSSEDKVPVLYQDSQMWSEVLQKSVNSSISHIYTRETLDDPIVPTSGYKFRLQTTYSGLGGGDVNIVRSVVRSSLYVPVKKNFLTASLQTTLGAAVPLNKENTIYLNDRFTSESVRGYHTLGDFNASTNEEYGGNVVATALARLIAPAPISFLRNELGMHLHAFANAGNVDTFDFKRGDYKDFWAKFKHGTQSSLGIGIVFLLSVGRVEFNACRPYVLPGQTLSHPFKRFEMKVVFE